jgi:hypothetical protein
MQDLNQMPTTPEEEEAMQDLTNKQQEQLKQHELAHQLIQGATGAQYETIDLKKFESVTAPSAPLPQHTPTVQELADQLTLTFNTLIKQILELQGKQPVSSSSEDLQECVSTVLEDADWFDDRLDDKLTDLVEEHDFSHDVENAVGSEVENYFGYNFNLEDHCDVYDLMRDAVDDKLEDMVQEKLEEILTEKLQSATITFN